MFTAQTLIPRVLASVVTLVATSSAASAAAPPPSACPAIYECLDGCANATCESACASLGSSEEGTAAGNLAQCSVQAGCSELDEADQAECIDLACAPEWTACFDSGETVLLPGDPCPEGFVDGCTGSTVQYCDGELYAELDCGELDLECGFDESAGAFACMEPPPVCPSDIPEAGVCSGSVLKACLAGEVTQINCADIGATCALDEATGMFDCIEETVVAPPPVVGEACPEGLDAVGICLEGVAYWCQEGGTVAAIDCAEQGLACGMVEGLNDCVPAEGGDYVIGEPCPAGLTFDGACDGDWVYWCEDGTTEGGNCADNGGTCGFSEANGYFDCVAPSGTGAYVPGDPCPEGLDFSGVCDTGSVYWCNENGLVATLDCDANGAVCGFNTEEGYNDCLTGSGPIGNVPAAGSPCPEGLDFGGACSGEIVYWCDTDGTVAVADCGDNGLTCEFDATQKVYDCLDKSGGPGSTINNCGEVDHVGKCDANSVVYCDDGELTSVDCSSLGGSCGYSTADGLFDCIGNNGGGNGGGNNLQPGTPILVEDDGGCRAGGPSGWSWMLGMCAAGWFVLRRRGRGRVQ